MGWIYYTVNIVWICNTIVLYLSGVDYIVECQIQLDDVGVEQVPIAFHLLLECNKKDFFIVRTLVTISLAFPGISLNVIPVVAVVESAFGFDLYAVIKAIVLIMVCYF